MAEKYRPSDEEMAKAEMMMLPLQKELTEKRLRVRQQLREKGVEGMLISVHYGWERTFADDPTGDTLRGQLSGHDIEVNHSFTDYSGRIDWHAMNHNQAKAVWDKYYEIAQVISSAELEAASDELRRQPVYSEQNRAAAELLKDIL